MFHFLYFLWFLLPLLFICLWLWAFVKPYFGVYGKESARSYFSQAVFCLAAFFIALWIDQKFLIENEDLMLVEFFNVDVRVARWLLYPGVLVAMAYAQWLIFRKPVKSHSKFTGTAAAIR